MSVFTLFICVALALGMVMGVVKPRRFGRFVVGLLVGPILIGIALTSGRPAFESLSPLEKTGIIAIGAITAVFVLLKIVLPRDVWAGVVSAFVYDVLKWVFLLPIKLGRSAFRVASRRAIK